MILAVSCFESMNSGLAYKRIESKLNRTGDFGRAAIFTGSRPSIKVDGLTIGEPPAFSSAQPFANTKRSVCAFRSRVAHPRRPKIEDLTLQDPQIELIQNAAGVWNFSDLGSSSSSGAGKTATLPARQVTSH